VQLEVTKLEADFYKEVQQLEAKYQALYQPLFDKVQRSSNSRALNRQVPSPQVTLTHSFL